MNTATSLNVLFDYKYEMSAIEQLKLTNAAGFQYIDMNFWDWGHSARSPFMNDGWEEWVKEIKECGDQLGVAFHQAHAMVYNPFTEYPEKEWRIEAARRSVIGAGILGVDWVVFHAQDCACAFPGKEDIIPPDVQLEMNNQWLAPYVRLAREHNTGIALENMNDGGKNIRYCTNAAQLIQLVDSFGAYNVGVCWDIGHAHCQKLDQYAEITSLGEHLKVLHVQDSDAVHDQHTAPYYGTVDWNMIKRALDDVKYSGEFTFEAHMIVRSVPDGKCKRHALKLLYEIGEHIIKI